jgi:hypothetical protein
MGWLEASQAEDCKHHLLHTEAGLIHARSSGSEREMTHAFVLFDQAEHVASLKSLGEDPYFLKFNEGFYQLKRAMALTVHKSPAGLQDSLNEAERLTASDLTRRRLIIDIMRAQGKLKEAGLVKSAITKEQCYIEATVLATHAFDVAKQIHSRLNRDRIEALYEGLVLSPYGDNPAVARLGLKLKMW